MVKTVTPIGKMSNLVNMWACIWKGDTLVNKVYIRGKADDQHYIVQAIDAWNGEPNICKIVELKDMMDWTFYPTREIAESCFDDYLKHNINRYTIKGLDKTTDI